MPVEAPRLDFPILLSKLPQADSPMGSTISWDFGTHQVGDIRDLLVDLLMQQDIKAMAAFIVSALSREIHDIKQQIDTMEGRVATLESSTSTVDTRLEALEVNQAAYRRHLIFIQLKIDV